VAKPKCLPAIRPLDPGDSHERADIPEPAGEVRKPPPDLAFVGDRAGSRVGVLLVRPRIRRAARGSRDPRLADVGAMRQATRRILWVPSQRTEGAAVVVAPSQGRILTTPAIG